MEKVVSSSLIIRSRKSPGNVGASGTFTFPSSRVGPARPVIGLTTYLQQAQTGVWDVRASFLPAIYIEGVNLAGGIAALLPPQPMDADIASRILDGDGRILARVRPSLSASEGTGVGWK